VVGVVVADRETVERAGVCVDVRELEVSAVLLSPCQRQLEQISVCGVFLFEKSTSFFLLFFQPRCRHLRPTSPKQPMEYATV